MDNGVVVASVAATLAAVWPLKAAAVTCWSGRRWTQVAGEILRKALRPWLHKIRLKLLQYASTTSTVKKAPPKPLASFAIHMRLDLGELVIMATAMICLLVAVVAACFLFWRGWLPHTATVDIPCPHDPIRTCSTNVSRVSNQRLSMRRRPEQGGCHTIRGRRRVTKDRLSMSDRRLAGRLKRLLSDARLRRELIQLVGVQHDE
jgi:hypothetical protein